MKELYFMEKAFQRRLDAISEVSNSIYDTQYTFNGKKVFKPEWLRKRFPTLYKEDKIIDADAANKAILDAGLVKPKQ